MINFMIEEPRILLGYTLKTLLLHLEALYFFIIVIYRVILE